MLKQKGQHSTEGESGSRFHSSNHSNNSHFTWFPRKNYNKSSRHGAQEHKEKETEQEWNNMYW